MSDDQKTGKPAQPVRDKLATAEDVERWLDLWAKSDKRAGDAIAYVNDVMNVALKVAQARFGERATPEHALAIFDRIDAERRRLIGVADAQDEAARRERDGGE